MGDNFAPEFVAGFVTGFITAGIVGFVVSKILWCWGRITAIGKPQVTMSSTDKTPWQVLADGCKSLLILIFLIAFILIGIFLCVAASSWG